MLPMRRRGQAVGARKMPDAWLKPCRCRPLWARVLMGGTPVFHLNTGVFFCEDTFLWFRTVTVRPGGNPPAAIETAFDPQFASEKYYVLPIHYFLFCQRLRS